MQKEFYLLLYLTALRTLSLSHLNTYSLLMTSEICSKFVTKLLINIGIIPLFKSSNINSFYCVLIFGNNFYSLLIVITS